VFLFGDYEGLRQGYPNSVIPRCRRTCKRQAIFRNARSKRRADRGLSIRTRFDHTADGSSRTTFPGNIIPSNRFDAVAAKTVGFYPQANLADPLTGQNNYSSARKRSPQQ